MKLIGRKKQLEFLKSIQEIKESGIIIIYGRRRTGKTTLIEEHFKERRLIKIEGQEGGSQKEQLQQAIIQLAAQLPKYPVTSWRPKTFTDLFRLIAPIIKSGTWTLYLEEYQWLSSYRTKLTAELKIIWDNLYRHNNQLLLILCGSAPSFMISKVLHSKSLYNRSQHELHLKPLTFKDSWELLGNKFSLFEAFNTFLLVGGIPEYLKRFKTDSSLYLSFTKQAFFENGFFVNEYERILISSLAKNKKYNSIIKLLAKNSFCDRKDLIKHLGNEGGTITELLEDLTLSGFIRSYVPIDKKHTSKLIRYTLADPFLRTYFKFIYPNLKLIKQGYYEENQKNIPSVNELQSHLGYAFEEFCQLNITKIAKVLGFSAVRYKAGGYFSRKVEEKYKKFQVDLVFQREDNVHTVCEIKYNRDKVGLEVISDFERRLSIYKEEFRTVRIQTVLICPYGANSELIKKGTFDVVLDVKSLLEEY